MKRFQQVAILLKLIQSLKEKGSWCGETHIQKATYFLQKLTKVPLDYEFILYKFGPFSFNLRDELNLMCVDEVLNVKTNVPPYGPSFFVQLNDKDIEEIAPKTIDKFKDNIIFIADTLKDKGATELECLATALYSILEKKSYGSEEEKAEYIHHIKPHIPVQEALEAIKTVNSLRENALTSTLSMC
jgi:uncharacterized protein YwgA